jgi:type VI secretion system protein ImpA
MDAAATDRTDATATDRVAKILSTFGGETPAGDDLRLDASPQSLYYRLRDARAAARAEERAAEDNPAAGGAVSAYWGTVQTLAIEALQSRSKDVEIAAWLAESLTRHDGLAGLAQGAAIIAGLIEQFWDNGLLPAEDPDDPEGRLIAITGLSGQDRDGSLLQPLRMTILFELDDGTPITFWEYDRARDAAPLAATGRAVQRTAPNAPSFTALEAIAERNGRGSFTALERDATTALGAWKTIEDVVKRVVRSEAAPSTGRVTALLETLRKTAARYLPITEVALGGSVEAAAGKLVTDAGRPASPDAVSDTASREAMLEQILQIAMAFRRTEPGSPISYTLEEAVRRARLSLPDLLRELLPELPARSSILLGLGIKPPSE